MWTNIPEHGEFAVENQKYARMVLHPDDLEAFNNYFSSEALLRLFGEGEKTDIQTVPASNGQGHIPYGRIYSGTDRTGQ